MSTQTLAQRKRSFQTVILLSLTTVMLFAHRVIFVAMEEPHEPSAYQDRTYTVPTQCRPMAGIV